MVEPPNPDAPRRLPARPFPPYAFVPGKFPHPITDPAGHSYGATPIAGEDEFLWAVDLFNHGYYWEAHEAWEAAWKEQGRRGREADFIKGLIKLAAAGVKAREGNAKGVARHARRARELFVSVQAANQGDEMRGCSLMKLIAVAEAITRDAQTLINTSPEPVVHVFDAVIDVRQ
jgi:hypothetical protein